MLEKFTLDGLTQDGVSVKKQTYIEYEGQSYPIGQLWSRSYKNSTRGRQMIVAELPLTQINAILAIWGDEPIIDETVIINQ